MEIEITEEINEKIMKKMKDINYTEYKTLFRRRKVEK